jgi:hypothetical protein
MRQRAWRVISFRHAVRLSTKRQLLQQGAELMGRDQLVMRLGIPETLLDAWIRGDITMPDGKLFVLAAILDNVAKAKKSSADVEALIRSQSPE